MALKTFRNILLLLQLSHLTSFSAALPPSLNPSTNGNPPSINALPESYVGEKIPIIPSGRDSIPSKIVGSNQVMSDDNLTQSTRDYSASRVYQASSDISPANGTLPNATLTTITSTNDAINEIAKAPTKPSSLVADRLEDVPSVHVEVVPLSSSSSGKSVPYKQPLVIPADSLSREKQSVLQDYPEIVENHINDVLPPNPPSLPSESLVPSEPSSTLWASPEQSSTLSSASSTSPLESEFAPSSAPPLPSQRDALLSSAPPPFTPDPLAIPPHVFSLFHFLLSPPPPPPPHPSNSSSAPLGPSVQDIFDLVFAVPQGCLPPRELSGGNYMLSLTPQAGLQYGVFLARIPRMEEFSLCLRFQISSLARSHFLFSYAVAGQDNAIMVFVSPGSKPGFGFYVNNVRRKAKTELHVRTWYSACMTWQSEQGRFSISLDGALLAEGSGMCSDCHIEEGGVAIVGLEQDRPGGGFNPGQVTHGHVTSLHLWQTLVPDLQPYQCCAVAEERSSEVKCSATAQPAAGGPDWVIEWGVTPIAVLGGALFVPINL